MKKYLLGAFLIVAMNLFGAKLSEVKGLEKLKNYNEIKDMQVEKIINYDVTKSISKKIISTVDNKFNGVLIKSENNDIVEISFYKNGISDGVSYTYYLNGDLKSVSTYRKGMIEGPQVLYRPNGKLESEQVFENNSLISEKYYKDTEKMSSTSTVMVNREKVDGVEKMSFIFDGETKVFREDGTLMAILQYKDSSLQDLIQKFYYPNGKIQYYIVAASDDMKDFKVKDRIITYYENGKVKQDCNQQNDGSWLCKNYDENGKFLDEEIRGAEPISNGDIKFWENILNPVLDVLAN